MKHFIIEITYTAPMEKILGVVSDHRAFLRGAMERGTLLFSGPQSPRVGGMLVVRAESREEIEQLIAGDPYNLAGLTSYRIIEFEPVLAQPFMTNWIAGD